MSNDVEQVGRVAIRKDGATLRTVAEALAERMVYVPSAELEAPKALELTDELVRALNTLPLVFGRVQVGEIRMLTEQERERLGDEQNAIDQIIKPLEIRREQIKELIRNHMDRVAVASGRVDDQTVVDGKGHYVVATKGNPEQVEIPGTTAVWSREFRAGKVEVDGGELLDMYERGEIDRKTYLAFTKEVRVFDEQKAFNAIAKDPSLLDVLRRMIKRGRPSTALFVRKMKQT